MLYSLPNAKTGFSPKNTPNKLLRDLIYRDLIYREVSAAGQLDQPSNENEYCRQHLFAASAGDQSYWRHVLAGSTVRFLPHLLLRRGLLRLV